MSKKWPEKKNNKGKFCDFQKVAFGLQKFCQNKAKSFGLAKTYSRPKQTTQKEARKCKPKASLRSGRQCPRKNSCPLYLLVYLFRAFWVLLHPLKVYWIHTNRQFTDEVHGAVAFFPVRSRTFLSTRRIFSVHILVPENMFQIFANTAFTPVCTILHDLRTIRYLMMFMFVVLVRGQNVAQHFGTSNFRLIQPA